MKIIWLLIGIVGFISSVFVIIGSGMNRELGWTVFGMFCAVINGLTIIDSLDNG